jgi:hypothetical protein
MSELRNEFSWSKSWDEISQTCPRQYYFNYYGYWGGWEKGPSERVRQIYLLKNLKNRFMWAGEKVHDCIKHTLKNLQRGISVLNPDDIVSITLNQMRDDFRSSRERRYRQYPKTSALFEHEYEVEIEDSKWKKVAEDVEKCVRNFYNSETFAMLNELPQENWLEIEDFSLFYLDGKKIWAVIDCSFRTEDVITIMKSLPEIEKTRKARRHLGQRGRGDFSATPSLTLVVISVSSLLRGKEMGLLRLAKLTYRGRG